jgi:hypothetical protein
LQVYDEGHKVGNYNKHGKHRRMVIRPKVLSEPTRAYQTGSGGAGHTSAVGMGALAHYIGNKGNTSWNYLGQHMATSCANSGKLIWDTHACAELGAFFGVLGASRAGATDLRRFLDYSKTWIILSETHDGGLVEQPFGCQRNATCSIERDRKSFTSVAILLLSLHLKNTLLTGAGGDVQAAPRVVGPRVVVPTVQPQQPATPSRAARKLSPKRLAVLDKTLHATLVKLSKEGRFKQLPMRISATKVRVWLAKAEQSGTLVFKVVGGNKSAAFTFASLTHRDRATLAEVCAAIKSESTDAQAMAGVYMESLDRMSRAETYYAKSNAKSRQKLESLFD